MSDMSEFYLSIFAIVCVAFVAGFLLRKTPARIFYVIIVSNIFLAALAVYFISWLAITPCLFIIAFMSVLVSSPQLRRDPSSNK